MITYDVLYKDSVAPTRKEQLTEQVLHSYACRNFKGFVSVLYHLNREKGEQFDLLLSSGGSGLAMIEMARLVFTELGVTSPRSLCLPVRRFKDEKTTWSENPADFYDNSGLAETVKTELNGETNIKNILYIDDDITQVGLASKTTLNLVIASLNLDPVQTSVTFVAEDHGFTWKPHDPRLKEVSFYRYSKKIPDTWQIVMNVVPAKILEKIREHFDDDAIRLKSIISILLGGAARKSYTSTEFTNDLAAEAKSKIPDFELLQAEFRTFLSALIKEGIQEYKAGNISVARLD